MERKAIEDSRKATLPADASGYKLELPADFVTPQGYRVQVRPQRSAGATRARVCARKWLVPSTVFKIDYDRRIAQVAELMQTNNAIAAQIKKPGASGTPRVNAIHTFMDAVLGAELARPFKATMVTEAMVRGWEKIMTRVSGQGVGTFSQAHREPPASNGKIPNYENLSFEQRRAAQTALRNRR